MKFTSKLPDEIIKYQNKNFTKIEKICKNNYSKFKEYMYEYTRQIGGRPELDAVYFTPNFIALYVNSDLCYEHAKKLLADRDVSDAVKHNTLMAMQRLPVKKYIDFLIYAVEQVEMGLVLSEDLEFGVFPPHNWNVYVRVKYNHPYVSKLLNKILEAENVDAKFKIFVVEDVMTGKMYEHTKYWLERGNKVRLDYDESGL